jgi:hypothetical protein
VEGSFEHGNEPLGSIKCWEILEQLSNWWLFKKDSAPWSLFNSRVRVTSHANIILPLIFDEE